MGGSKKITGYNAQPWMLRVTHAIKLGNTPKQNKHRKQRITSLPILIRRQWRPLRRNSDRKLVTGKLNGSRIETMIDSGSIHSYVDEQVVQMLELAILPQQRLMRMASSSFIQTTTEI